MAHRGVRFADGSLPGPPPPKHWVVPSFSSFKVPPPPPSDLLLVGAKSKAHQPPNMTIGSAFSMAEIEKPLAVDTTPHKTSPPKLIQTGGGEEDSEPVFASLSATALLSPISAMTEVTTQSPSISRPKRPTTEIMEPTQEESPTDASFETLATIDMLNFEFVRACTSAKDIGRIIRVLMDHNKSKNAPEQLLQAARQRLQVVQGKRAPPPPPRNKKPMPHAEEKTAPPTKGLIAKPVPPPPPPPPPPPKLCQAPPPTAVNEEKKDEANAEVRIHPSTRVVPSVSNDEQENHSHRYFDDDKEEKSPGRILTESTANLSRITLGNTTLESIDPSKGSLNLSYSPPSVLRGLDLVDTPSHKGLETSGLISESLYTRLGKISEVSTSGAVTPSSLYQEQLTVEVKRLSGDAVEMERQSAREQVHFMEQLEKLQRSKHEAESLIRTLETKAEAASSEKAKALHSMHEMQKEQQHVRRALLEERARLQQRDNETKALEERLQGKIAELQKALTEEAERYRMTLRDENNRQEQTATELAGQRERNVELNLLLRQTKENLERIKKTQDIFRFELLKAFGVDEEELKHVPQNEFIQRMVQRVREIKSENMKLSEALKKAQSAPNMIIRERDQLRHRIREVLRTNRTLEEENANLGSKIEELSEEVISSRALIDKLLKTSHETHVSEWEKKESQYKAAIRNYQQQIREQASTVSLELYRAAVDDSKRTQSQLQDATRKILDLETKVLSLETREGPTGGVTKTPNPKKGHGLSFYSPTDYLEKGLLFRDFHQKSPAIPLTLSVKKPKTPISQVKTGMELDMGRPTSSNKKSYKTTSYRSPIENLRRLRVAETEDTFEPPVETGVQGDVIGMTITFENPVGGLPSPEKEERPGTNESVGLYVDKVLATTETKDRRRSALARYDPKKSVLSPSGIPTPTTPNEGDSKNFKKSGNKENDVVLLSPKSASKTLRMQKARELGGMKGLKSHLNKIRSPQPMGKTQRTPLAERKLNY